MNPIQLIATGAPLAKFREAIALKPASTWLLYGNALLLSILKVAEDEGEVMSSVDVFGVLGWLNEGRLERIHVNALSVALAKLETDGFIVGSHDSGWKVSPLGLILMASLIRDLNANPDMGANFDFSDILEGQDSRFDTMFDGFDSPGWED